jgi:hypothetical protein
MECALCTNPILMEVHGFAQLACKHTFHLRCMVPACNQFWSNGPIGCKICGSDDAQPVAANALVAANLPNNEQAAALVRQREVTVDDAYRLISDLEEKKYEDKVAEHIKTLTPSQKADLKKFVKSVRLCKKKLRPAVRSEIEKRRREFIQKNNHLIVLLNKAYRKVVKDCIETDKYKLYWKTYQKNKRLLDKISGQVTDNGKYEIEDICMALKYSRVPIYLTHEMQIKRFIRYRFYTVADQLFDVKNLDKPVY